MVSVRMTDLLPADLFNLPSSFSSYTGMPSTTAAFEAVLITFFVSFAEDLQNKTDCKGAAILYVSQVVKLGAHQN